jgi:L-threonylcarbamoyladenylate synthase
MDFSEDVEHCLRVLSTGGIIVYPTDTVWGIGCDATSAQSVEKIFNLKRRPPKKSFIILLADRQDILKYVSHPEPQIFEFLETVKKPTTVIYEGAINLAENLVGEDGSIAIRLVKDAFCRHLIKRLRRPLVSTSANISGEPAPGFFGEIALEIIRGVDYTVHYRRDDLHPGEPSSVVRLQKDGTIEIIRQ